MKLDLGEERGAASGLKNSLSRPLHPPNSLVVVSQTPARSLQGPTPPYYDHPLYPNGPPHTTLGSCPVRTVHGTTLPNRTVDHHRPPSTLIPQTTHLPPTLLHTTLSFTFKPHIPFPGYSHSFSLSPFLSLFLLLSVNHAPFGTLRSTVFGPIPSDRLV